MDYVWLILGYFGVIVGSLGFIIIYFSKDEDITNMHPIAKIFVGIFTSLFWIAIGIWAFSEIPSYKYDKSLAEKVTLIMIVFFIFSIIISILISLKKAAQDSNNSFLKRISVSAISGLIVSIISHFLGIENGINILSLGIGGIVFISVSLFNP